MREVEEMKLKLLIILLILISLLIACNKEDNTYPLEFFEMLYKAENMRLIKHKIIAEK